MLPMLQHLTIDPALVVTNPLWQAPSMADHHAPKDKVILDTNLILHLGHPILIALLNKYGKTDEMNFSQSPHLN